MLADLLRRPGDLRLPRAFAAPSHPLDDI